VASISIVSSFPLKIFLNLCINSQILLLHSTGPKKKLLTLLSTKTPSTHPLFYICQTYPNPLILSLMPHNMLLVPYLNREDTPFLTTPKPCPRQRKIIVPMTRNFIVWHKHSNNGGIICWVKKPFCIPTTTLRFSSTLNRRFRNKGTLNGPPTFNNFS
jgi:hypothetical protein